MKLNRNETQPLDAIVIEEANEAPPISKERLNWLIRNGANVRSLPGPLLEPKPWIKQEPYRASESGKWILALIIILAVLWCLGAAVFGYFDATYSITGYFDR